MKFGTINEAKMYGAVDVISKMATKGEIAAAIRAAAMVVGVVDDPLSETPPNLRSRLSTLTGSQFHVLRKLREGKLNKQIAYELGIRDTMLLKAHIPQGYASWRSSIARRWWPRRSAGACGVASAQK